MSAFPETALDWLAVWTGVRGLTIGDDPALPKRLAKRSHKVFALAPEESLYSRFADYDGVLPLRAHPTAIPTEPFQFEVVFCHQSFHRMEAARVLPQVARVLRPGGCFSLSYLIRDDSVPWVRRLAALLRRYDPMAMRGDYGHDSLDAVRNSDYFPEVEERAFRIWQTMSRDAMAEMVRKQPLTNQMSENQVDRLVEQVLDLYDSAAKPGEELKLPFQLLCVRGWVDHAELSRPVRIPDAGLEIKV